MPTETPYQKGRHKTGYLKRKLFEFTLGTWGFDGYLLRYPEGAYIPTHTDPVEGRHHTRLNIELRKAQEGGVFHANGPVFRLPRITLFRPDVVEHEVTEITHGMRLVLSFGWARP